jgi:hypothetical protein
MASATALDLIHRLVGAAHQAVQRLTIIWLAAGDPDRQCDPGSVGPDDLGHIARHGITQKLGALRGGHVIGANEPNREFIAAEAGDQIAWAKCPAQQCGGATQDVVAHFMAQPVVDRLEMIEVGEDQRTGLVVAILPHRVTLHLLQKRTAIEQAGQRVGPRLPGHVELEGLPFQQHADDLGDRADQQAVIAVPGAVVRMAPGDETGVFTEPGAAGRDEYRAPIRGRCRRFEVGGSRLRRSLRHRFPRHRQGSRRPSRWLRTAPQRLRRPVHG